MREIRKAAGLTLDDVAARTGIDAANLSKLETGKGPENTGTKTLGRIARALGVPVVAFFSIAPLHDKDAA